MSRSNFDPQAIEKISTFARSDPESLRDYRELAHALGGMAAAVSSVSLVYGSKHPVDGKNQGLQISWLDDDTGEPYKFIAHSQGLEGTLIQHCADEQLGNNSRYLDFVTIPDDALLGSILLQPEVMATSDDPMFVEATRVRQNPDHPSKLKSYEYVPFYVRSAPMPEASEANDEPTRENVVGYATVLRDLFRLLLNIIA